MMKRINHNMVVARLKAIEKIAYKGNDHMMQLQDCDDIKDVADYCEVSLWGVDEYEDRGSYLIIFKGHLTIFLGHKWYCLIGSNMNGEAEICDLAETPDNTYVPVRDIWNHLRYHYLSMTMDCKEDTSYKFIKLAERIGQCRITKDREYSWCGVIMHEIEVIPKFM